MPAPKYHAGDGASFYFERPPQAIPNHKRLFIAVEYPKRPVRIRAEF